MQFIPFVTNATLDGLHVELKITWEAPIGNQSSSKLKLYFEELQFPIGALNFSPLYRKKKKTYVL